MIDDTRAPWPTPTSPLDEHLRALGPRRALVVDAAGAVVDVLDLDDVLPETDPAPEAP